MVAISSGSLTIGAHYRITAAGGTFTGVGAADNNVGTEFVATGTSPTWGSGAVIPIGALSLQIVQPIQVLDDATGNAQCGLLTPGMSPVTTRKDFRIVARTSTNGNQQLLGGNLFADYSNVRFGSWVIRNNGASARTVSLGTASGGSQYVSGFSATAGNSSLNASTIFAGGAALWCNSNGTDELVHTITGNLIGK
jgi:hypothetical protein